MNPTEALAWIADLFEEPAENIQPDTPRDAIDAWDSLGVLNLMAGLDETFDILLEDEDVQNMRCVEDIMAILRKHGQLDESG